MRLSYPGAERLPGSESLHGHEVADPYRWLEDTADPRTRAWQAAQDDLWLTHAEALPDRAHFRARVGALNDVQTTSTPSWRGDRQFFTRRDPGQEHAILYARDLGGERVLVDPMALDPTGLTTLDRWQPSLDGGLLAFQVSRGGDEQSVLSVLDVATGDMVDGPIDRCRYSPVAWLPGGEAFYYVRSRRLYLHRLGRTDDEQVLTGEASYGLEISADGNWLTISAVVAGHNEVWIADLVSGSEPVIVQEGVDARTALAVGPDGRIYVATTLDAPYGRICVGDPRTPRPEHWKELIAEEPGAPLSQLAVLDGVLLVGRTRHALAELTVHDLPTGRPLHDVPLPGLGTIGELCARPEGGHEAWFSYTDSVTPPTVYRYDVRDGSVTPWDAVAGGVREVESRQLFCTSRDGTPVRLVVLARAGTGQPRPTILYGYGGFGLSLTPTYSSFALAWVEAGGVFVTANLRGGGEQGEAWHRAGVLGGKQNVIDDFLAAAEKLIADGWTTPDHLGICGESNGGLLVGAALTQRPELFAAAVCSAPVLDMVRYQLTGLGASWVSEYGSADDPAQLGDLLAYSPYHRVTELDYPAVLFTTFNGDTRVDPLHARKMCAALQYATTSPRPILLRAEPDSGHLPSGTSRATALAADMLAFLAHHTGHGGRSGVG